MKFYLAKEFTESDWYPNYKKIKKKLRNSNVPFTIRKLSTDNGMLHSIWSSEEHIEQVREIVARHYLKDLIVREQINRAKVAAQNFEEKWIRSIVFVLMAKAISHPILFAAMVIVVVAMIVYPYFNH